ncbi:MAG: hypothetical protein R2991_16870 [Thermoanaerobaculia bacterium]
MQCIRSDSTLFVLALAFLFGSGLAAAQDTDGDAIPDSIENQSWYLDAGGSPQRQDVWVECDYMRGTVKKRNRLRRRVEQVFDRAPVPGGITLHVTFDEKLPFEEQWGDVGTPEGILETFQKLFDTYDARFDVRPFNGAHADTMRPYGHYCMFVESIGGDGVSGFSPGIPGDLFVVALGQYRGQVPGRELRAAEAGTMLHELGHNLGLTHGGARPRPHANYKPNYLSVMNYAFQFGFLRRRQGNLEFFNYWDYSRGRSNLIHERKLHEMEGVILPVEATVADTQRGDELLGITFCPESNALAFRFNGPVDFDCDGTIDGGKVKVDTNRDGRKNKLGRVQVDWDNLVFGTAGIGAGGRVELLDPLSEMRRPDVELRLRLREALRDSAGPLVR